MIHKPNNSGADRDYENLDVSDHENLGTIAGRVASRFVETNCSEADVVEAGMPNKQVFRERLIMRVAANISDFSRANAQSIYEVCTQVLGEMKQGVAQTKSSLSVSNGSVSLRHRLEDKRKVS